MMARSMLMSAVLMSAVVTACGGNGGNGERSGDGTTATGQPAMTGAAPPTTTAPATPAERGKSLAGVYNCRSCHSTMGVGMAGPTFKGLAGSTVQLEDGGNVVADQEYLVRSITDPDAQVVKGYQKGIMSAVIRPGSVSREEAEALAAYIESLR